MTRWDTTTLPADRGVRAAARFYLRRLAILAALILLAALLPALAVLFRHFEIASEIVLAVSVTVLLAVWVSRRKSREAGTSAVTARRRAAKAEPLDALGSPRHWLELLRLVPGLGAAISLLIRMLSGR